MKHTRAKIRPMCAGRPRGFSIVEVLVALVVLATGMLGIASLYVTTLRASGSAISRMQAVNLASDLGDRIRANRGAGEAYEGAPAAAADAGACLGTTADCTADEIAAQDLLLWNQQIAATLPTGATGTVTVTPEAGGIATYEIQLTWTEPGEGNLTYLMRFQR